jgi:peptide/nickel transport system permease protein
VTRWVIRRTLEAVLLTAAGTIVLVALVHLLPGDPVAAIVGDRALDPRMEEALRSRWGLDRPLHRQVLGFLSGAVRGDLGLSIAQERPVSTILAERLGPTLLLGGLTLLINFTVGLAIGLWSALRPHTLLSRAIGVLTLASYTVPSFVIGLMLVWVFAIEGQWLPAGGAADPLRALDAPMLTVLLDRVRHLVLPLATMVLATIAVPIRHQLAAAAATVEAPWVVAARARGVGPWRVAWRHVWRPALSPVITLLGLWLPLLVSGAVFVEAVFAWPGIGALIAESTASRDLPLVIGAGVLLVAAVQLGSLLADMLYRLANPVQRQS